MKKIGIIGDLNIRNGSDVRYSLFKGLEVVCPQETNIVLLHGGAIGATTALLECLQDMSDVDIALYPELAGFKVKVEHFTDVLFSPVSTVHIDFEVDAILPISLFGLPQHLLFKLGSLRSLIRNLEEGNMQRPFDLEKFSRDAVTVLKNLKQTHATVFALRNQQIISNADHVFVFTAVDDAGNWQSTSETLLPIAALNKGSKKITVLPINITKESCSSQHPH